MSRSRLSLHYAGEPEPAAGSGHILREIYALLQAAGEPLDEERLLQGLRERAQLACEFPSRQSLAQLLASSDLFVCDPAGRWQPAIWRLWQRELEHLDFVVLDIETTGLRPGRDRIIELGAWRLRGELLGGRFHSLVNPEQPVSAAIVRLTGIDEQSLAAAPTIGLVLPELLRFCSGAILVGHNLGFDLHFLAYETAPLNARLPVAGIDVLTLARRLLPDQRRCGLAALARRLQVPLTTPHRALADAEATAMVFVKLLQLARQQGLTTYGQLLQYLQPASAGQEELSTGLARSPSVPGQPAQCSESQQAERHSARRRPDPTVWSPLSGMFWLNPAWRRTFPAQPGVYLMKDGAGHVLYVGKARCLKARLASYYHHRPGIRPRIDSLLPQVQAIETRPLGSELEALLVESQLIKELQPPYNTQLRDYERYPFLKVDVHQPFPRFGITREPGTDGARYFGPFRSERSLAVTLELLERLFPLATCTRPLPPAGAPSAPCLRYHLGRCLAPCSGQADPASYRQMIEEVCAFLTGKRPELLARVRHQMEEAAQALHYERAARLRDMLQSAEEVLLSQRLISSAVAANNLLIAYPSAWEGYNEIFLIRHGRLLELQRVPHEEQATRQALGHLLARAAALPSPPTTVGQAEIDQIMIISRWIKRHSRDRAFFPLTSQVLVEAQAREQLIEAIWQALCAQQRGPATRTQPQEPGSDDQARRQNGSDVIP
ncbi:exonuclease domain-containing protein [Thermogemmatispora tikiterensis]|uniref:exonuclease domain-containing protein n=1 Tax=Thermogemmatispora tikiterensis TaxID=1825093 RepID=UPI000DD8F3AA|nr:exonuclease domain-containing protein [Thermogemmatispora tikiterensis]